MRLLMLGAGLFAGTIGYSAAQNNVQQEPPLTAAEAIHQVMASSCEDMGGMQLTGSLNEDFIKLMIHHHQSAISMSEAYLAEGSNPELVAIAQKVIFAQKKEIEELQAILKEVPSNNKATAE